MKRSKLPTKAEAIAVFRDHPLVKMRRKVKRVAVVGSRVDPFREVRKAKSSRDLGSDIDIVMEVSPVPGVSARELTQRYRQGLAREFMARGIEGKDDLLHPLLCGTRADLYLVYDLEVGCQGPMVELH